MKLSKIIERFSSFNTNLNSFSWKLLISKNHSFQ